MSHKSIDSVISVCPTQTSSGRVKQTSHERGWWASDVPFQASGITQWWAYKGCQHY